MSLAVVIKTFHRDNCLYKCIKSIKKHIPEAIIYVGDDGFMTDEKEQFYIDNKVNYFYLEHNCGISEGRNKIIEKVKEDYILLLDDDFVITEEINYKNVIKQLEKSDNIILISGILYDIKDSGTSMLKYAFDVEIKDRKIQKKDLSRVFINDIIKYRQSDLMINFFIAKRKLFDKVKWDERLKIGTEHMDFFLKIKYNTDWIAVQSPNMRSEHRPIVNEIYRKYRARNKHFPIFADNWDVDEIREVNNTGFNYRTLEFYD